jgi:hypothetical protein
MQQPTDQQLRQAAFRPGWLPLPEPAAKRGSPLLRGLAVVALALVGAFLGMVIGVEFGMWISEAAGVVLMFAGAWLGLAGGIWLGVRATSRKRH